MQEKFLSVIDETGVPTKALDTDTVHKKGLLHRAVHILVINNKEELFLRRRAKDKKLYPGVLSSSVGAHVVSGETPNHTAQENLKVFLGLEVPVVKIGEKGVKDDIENELVSFYIVHANTIVDLNPEESDEGSFMDIVSIQELVNQHQTTPHLATALKIYEEYRRKK